MRRLRDDLTAEDIERWTRRMQDTLAKCQADVRNITVAFDRLYELAENHLPEFCADTIEVLRREVHPEA